MKNYTVHKSCLSGLIAIPSSKSQSIRSILFASLADGVSTIQSFLPSPDIFAMIAACQHLGAKIDRKAETLEIQGVNGQVQTPSDIIDAGNSGQVLRFIACLAGLQKQYMVITGDASIQRNRPVQPLIEALPQLGMVCESLRGDGHAPLILKGPFSGYNNTALDGEDSQPVSGLLMAAVFMPGTTQIEVRNPGETPWVDLTLQWLDRFSIVYHNRDYSHYKVQGDNTIPAFHYCVPGDLSSLSFPLVAALITGSALVIENVDMDEPQGDKAIVTVLQSMGARIHIDAVHKKIIVDKIDKLQGVDININDFIDCIAILAVVGCCAMGATRITGAAIARQKESDRIAAIAAELRKMGADIEELDDGLLVRQSVLTGAVVESHHDHRIAMSLAVAGLVATGETIVQDVQCVDKSFPKFSEKMQPLGADIKVT
jgi:3-phosphoshikimate 1-carboxyvinyltransferase